MSIKNGPPSWILNNFLSLFWNNIFCIAFGWGLINPPFWISISLTFCLDFGNVKITFFDHHLGFQFSDLPFTGFNKVGLVVRYFKGNCLYCMKKKQNGVFGPPSWVLRTQQSRACDTSFWRKLSALYEKKLKWCLRPAILNFTNSTKQGLWYIIFKKILRFFKMASLYNPLVHFTLLTFSYLISMVVIEWYCSLVVLVYQCRSISTMFLNQ